MNSTEQHGPHLSALNNTDGKTSLVKQDSLRRNYHATGLKSLQNSENKLYQAKLHKMPPVTTTHIRQRSENIFPSSLQTTAAFSPEMPMVQRQDTRPAFLGGKYQSKVKGVSEVGQYIKHGRNTLKVHRTVDQDDDSYNVNSYFRTKMMMKDTLDRAYSNQVKQYHHDYRQRNIDQKKFQTQQPSQQSERDQGDLELPQITLKTPVEQQPIDV